MAKAGAGPCEGHLASIRPADTGDPAALSDATKLEAWNGRGGGDHLRSHDLEDIITLIDGRVEIVDEVDDAPSDLRSFLSREIATLLDQPRFKDTIDGTVVGFGRGGSGDEDRVDEIVLPRFHALAGPGQ